MNSELSVKVLIDKSELIRLRAIERQHQECNVNQDNIAIQSGRGDLGTAGILNEPDSTSAQAKNTTLNKDIILNVANESASKDIILNVANESASNLPRSTSLSKSDILQSVRKRYQVPAKKLLSSLQTVNGFYYDDNGICYFNSERVNGSSIFDLIQTTFYDTKSKECVALELWQKLLKDNNLTKFIKNPRLLSSDKVSSEIPKFWYYLGEIIQ